MAKPKSKKFHPQQKKPQQSFIPSIPSIEPLFPLKGFGAQSIFLVLVGIIIYFNSVYNPVTKRFNRYALDDDIVMRLNEYVQQGFRGIDSILTTDSYNSFFKSMGSTGELHGGRYRPLSIVTFAIEQQLFGECYGVRFSEVGDSLRMLQHNPIANHKDIKRLIAEKTQLEAKISKTHEEIAPYRHVIQVILYITSIIILLWLLRNYIFRYANLKFVHPHDLAFFATLIFLVHPIHTEVVANIKSRDEILSFMFICLTFIFLFKNLENKKTSSLVWGMVFYFLALLSKEWGITLVGLIPIALFVFCRFSVGQVIRTSAPYFIVAVFYLIIRSMFVGAGKQGEITEVLNNPYVFANPSEKLATQIYVLVKYLRLLFFPYPLSADYSWKTIPYRNFGDIIVWFSVLVHLVMIYFMFKFIFRRHWLGFAIAFYLFHLFLVSNLIMSIGATMGERLIYHSSLGFVMVTGYYLLFGLKKIIPDSQTKTTLSGKIAFIGLTLLIAVPMSYKTIERNPNWETDNILFMHDAWVVPNSVLANGNAGKAFIEEAQKDTANRLALLDSAIYHLEKAVSFHPKYVNGYLNLGLAWFQKKDLDKAEFYWNEARKHFPTHPFFRQSYDPALVGAFIENAKQAGMKGNVPLAIKFLERALKYDNTNPETWYHYGGANFQLGNLNEAYIGFSKCLQLNPDYSEARNGLNAVTERMKQRQIPLPAVK